MPRRKPDKRNALGSAYQRADGRWVASLDLGIQNGKRKRVVRYPKDNNEDAARRLLAQMITESGRGLLQQPTGVTVEEWLTQHVNRKDVPGTKAKTIQNWRREIALASAHIGRLKLSRVTGLHVQRTVDALVAAGYSYRTVSKVLQRLTAAFDEALAMDLLTRNPAAGVKAPRQAQAKAITVWNREEAGLFLQAVERHHYALLYHLMVGLGMRIGEAIALKVTDYHPEKRTISVLRTIQPTPGSTSLKTDVGAPKTRASRRTIRLPTTIITQLEAHLERREQLSTRPGYTEEGWLVPSDTGGILLDRNVRRHFDLVIERINTRIKNDAPEEQRPKLLPRLTPHELRYTFINLARRAGMPFDKIAQIVGHSSPVITMRVYYALHPEEMHEEVPELDTLFALTPPAQSDARAEADAAEPPAEKV